MLTEPEKKETIGDFVNKTSTSSIKIVPKKDVFDVNLQIYQVW